MELIKDQLLLQDIIIGKKHSFRLLFNRYYKALCLFADSFLNSISEAEDTVQSVFVNIWECRETLSDVASIKSYLYQSVRNACLNILKHRRVEEKNLEELKNSEIEIKNQNGEEQEEKYRLLYHAINMLPPKSKEVLKLSVFNELSYNEIANKLNISVNTVKYHIKTAYHQLRKKIV